MELFLMTITTGVMVGGIYALVALGWVLIYKCSGVLNLAMGEPGKPTDEGGPLASMLGAGGIGLQLQASLNTLAWPQVTMILLLILGTVLVSEWLSAKVRHAVI